MLRSLPVVLALTATALVVPVGSAAAAPTPAPRPAASASERVPGIPVDPLGDLPHGAPPAARRPEPTLPTPQGWPFEQELSHTSGTEVLDDGASYWSDFVYDDHGAAVPSGFTLQNTALLAPFQGVYTYPDGPAHDNGADVFVAATGADADATYWRVDWNTLVDPDVPLAVWSFDTDDDAGTGSSAWPAAAGVTSPGIEKALVVSSRGAWLHDLRTGDVTDVAARGGRLSVDPAARSFVVKVPTVLLPVDGRWRVRLAAGLADAAGTSLARPTISGLPAVGLPRVYNVAFRSVTDEPSVVTDSQTAALVAAFQALAAATPPFDRFGADGLARFVTGNFWNEDAQADALAGGDVSAFSHVVDWNRLRQRASTTEPLVKGNSTRWYVSRLRLGQGVVADGGTPGAGDGRPNFIGRIQPYSVYVPRSYRADRGAAPLTWTLHSLSVNHNQYAAYNPKLQRQLCEDRGSICAGTLGFGPDGWYFDEAEVDYWAVWGALARSYRLDPRRTVITGYSMGGWATYNLGLAHPDLYAAAVTLAGPPSCGVSVDGDQVTMPAFGGRCTSDGSSRPLIRNARWLPYLIGQGTVDELVPFTSVEQQVARFDALGLQHRFVRYPGEDHLAFATQDRFDTVVAGLTLPKVERRPRTVDFTWRPHLTRGRFGIGATTAYWTAKLRARDVSAGSLARVHAVSHALPGHRVGLRRTGPTAVTTPLPGSVSELSWTRGKPYARSQNLYLRLRNTRGLTVDLVRAGIRCGGAVGVQTDGPTRLVLRHGAVKRVFSITGSKRLRLRC